MKKTDKNFGGLIMANNNGSLGFGGMVAAVFLALVLFAILG